MSDEITPVSPNAEVKNFKLAIHPPDMPPAEQVLHILGQHDMVWCGKLASKHLQALAMVLQEERRLFSQHQIWHIADCRLAVVFCSLILPCRK